MSNTERTMESKSKGSMKEWFKSSQALYSMLLVQVFTAGMQLLSRVILVQGTFIFALITYRQIVAAIFVAPFALYFERGQEKKFTLKVCFWLFINALMGMALAQGLYYFGLRDTSATYSINFLNMVPICTFIVCILCRMEKLGLQKWSGKAKCGGAILCVGGALFTSLYKGKEFYLSHHSHHANTSIAAHQTHMLRGTFFLICTCFSYTAWFIVQVKLLKVFPLRYWGTMLSCILAAVQAAIIGFFTDSSKAAWKLDWNLQLLTILYSGAVATAALFCLMSWVIALKGPTYAPMFNPLALIFVAFSEAFILGEPLSVGMLVGVVLIMVGLYLFLCGKKSETWGIAQAQPNVSATEVLSMSDLPAGVQSTATVVPSSSPMNNVVLEIENPDKT